MSADTTRARAAAIVAIVSLSIASAASQTVVKPPKNKYAPQQDVEIGRKAAAQVRRQYPIIEDARVAKYLSKLGDRLVAAAPPELNEAVYEYSFTPVNLKEINAFALPGGPMFVHRGMIDAAESTTFLADGSLFYYLTVAPEADAGAFEEAFRRIGNSIRLTDAR